MRQLEAKLKVGASRQEYDFVFCTSVGTHLHPDRDFLSQLTGCCICCVFRVYSLMETLLSAHPVGFVSTLIASRIQSIATKRDAWGASRNM